MLVILASRGDVGARALVERWASHRTALLTCEDLSVPGWRYELDAPATGWAVIAGRRVPVAEIAGVLVRWPAIFERELVRIDPGERAYVAAEMTAFLRSWLTTLPCPVLNRPSATSLTGPSWRPEQWVHAAAHCGIPVRPVRRCVARGDGRPPPAGQGEHATVTVVGGGAIGAVDPILADWACRLAAAAGVGLLAAHFSGRGREAALLSADLLPDFDGGEIADAILEYLLAGRHAPTAGRRQ